MTPHAGSARSAAPTRQGLRSGRVSRTSDVDLHVERLREELKAHKALRKAGAALERRLLAHGLEGEGEHGDKQVEEQDEREDDEEDVDHHPHAKVEELEARERVEGDVEVDGARGAGEGELRACVRVGKREGVRRD